MRVLVLDPPPAEFEALLQRRRRLGLDRRDEIWEGVLHVGPAPLRRHAVLQAQLAELLGPRARTADLEVAGAFNLGSEDDFRIPDGALLEPGPGALYLPSAALVVEILSPGDESWQKLPFHAAHAVGEVLIVDPDKRAVTWLELAAERYRQSDDSRLIELTAAQLAGEIAWPG